MKTIRLDGVVGYDITAAGIANQIADTQAPVNLIINTPGGSPLEAFSIYNMLQEHQGEVNIRADLAASAGSIIAMAGKLSMSENTSLMMIHNVTSMSIGGKNDFRKEADVIEMIENKAAEIYATKSGRKKSEFIQMMEDETWFDAAAAVNIGLADTIIRANRSNLLNMALSYGKTAQDHESMVKFCAKIDAMREKVNNVNLDISSASSLKEIEAAFRDDLGLSKAEAKVFVSRIKAIIGRDDCESEGSILLQNKVNQFLQRLDR